MTTDRNDRPKRIAVVGAGVSGLAAAHRLVELSRENDTSIEITLFEARDQPGGSIVTHDRDGFLVEGGPDSFITQKPWALALCKRLGIEDELVPTNPACRRTFVVRRGKLYPIPEGFLLLAPSRIRPFLTSRLFSWPGKLRMGLDVILPRKDHGEDGDESLASFVRRRFGAEALERVAQPLVGGVYTANPETLSLRSTMPRFLDMEAKHRSLILAMRRGMKAVRRSSTGTDSGARYSMFVSLEKGMARFVEVLRSQLPADTERLNTPVKQLRRENERWQLRLDDNTLVDADALVLATPAYASADMIRELDPDLAEQLGAIQYASSATMSLAFRREQVAHPLDGFGFVVPYVERRTLMAVTFNSVKFPGRAPDGWVLMRAFLGGAMQPEVFDQDDASLEAGARRDLEDLIGLHGDPAFVEIHRWPRSMPQYPVGHLDRVAKIRQRLAGWPNLAVAGNAFGGVGIPDCVNSGEQAAEAVFAATCPE